MIPHDAMPGGTVTLVEALSLPPRLLTVSEMVLSPDVLNLVVYLDPLPLDAPPLHEYVSGVPPLRLALQATLSSTCGEDGEQLMLLIAGASIPRTATAIVPETEPPLPSLAVIVIVAAPAERAVMVSTSLLSDAVATEALLERTS